MKKAVDCTTDDVQEGVPQEIDGDSDAMGEKIESEVSNLVGTSELIGSSRKYFGVFPDWFWKK